MVYSNLRNFKSDLVLWRPHFLIAVPRLFETIHKSVVSNLRQQSQASALKRRLISTLTACTQLYLRFYKTWANLLIRAKKPSVIERFASLLGAILMWPIFKISDIILWSKIRQNLGGRLKVMVSGGSALPLHIASFFDMAGLKMLAGYGLTETSPTLANNLGDRNVLGSVGRPPKGTEIRIVELESREEVPIGQSGVILARGPGVMVGYNDNPRATAEVIGTDGFFDTGDLGRINPATGDLIMTGRAKDTIVLSNGENIEPQPIEDAMIGTSPLIDQAMIVGSTDGQDMNFLSALVVVNGLELAKRGLISMEKGEALDKALGPTPQSTGPADLEFIRSAEFNLSEDTAIKEAIMQDLSPVFDNLRPWERVQAIEILLEPWSMTNGMLTPTLKVKRPVIATSFKESIERMFSSTRKSA